MKLYRCARCGGNHRNLKVKKFKNPPKETAFSHWAKCPKTNDPILIMVVNQGGIVGMRTLQK